eukprot:TRINITY_DN4716_c0_g1_i1.p1 TRINITY_DN4716_c0_g1~~TRINITY_DN4716_c0_g1_i1.p1  ORF type:complete len:383 (+),score=91.57 TRINITY_DN4716_c0_g1_i1:252-1400(+)
MDWVDNEKLQTELFQFFDEIVSVTLPSFPIHSLKQKIKIAQKVPSAETSPSTSPRLSEDSEYEGFEMTTSAMLPTLHNKIGTNNNTNTNNTNTPNANKSVSTPVKKDLPNNTNNNPPKMEMRRQLQISIGNDESSTQRYDDFMKLDPNLLAEQLISIECRLFGNVNYSEFQHWNKRKKGEDLQCPNLVLLTERFNTFSNWVTNQIVTTIDNSQRKLKVERFIDVAQICFEYRSFNTVMEIIGAFEGFAVHRLSKTFESISRPHQEKLKTLKEFCSPQKNFGILREAQKVAKDPTLPFIGVYLADLVFLSETDTHLRGVKSNSGQPLLNYQKFVKMGKTILFLRQKQQLPYDFNEDTEVYNKLKKLQTISEEDALKASKNIEN